MSGPSYKLKLPNHHAKFLQGARWILDRISAGDDFKLLDHLVSSGLQKNKKYQLTDETLPRLMAGFRVPLTHRRD